MWGWEIASKVTTHFSQDFDVSKLDYGRAFSDPIRNFLPFLSTSRVRPHIRHQFIQKEVFRDNFPFQSRRRRRRRCRRQRRRRRRHEASQRDRNLGQTSRYKNMWKQA